MATLTPEGALVRALDRAPARPELLALPLPALLAHLSDPRQHPDGPPSAQAGALLPLAAKVAQVHGPREPGLHRLRALVQALYEALEPYEDHAERVLFPALLGGERDTRAVREARATLAEDHRQLAALLEQVRLAAGGFRPPAHACSSYTALLGRLATLEGALLARLHLEHHALLPHLPAA